jgi:hypothetical protein
MFVQVIEGRPGNVEALRSQLETWRSDLAPGADGWLGATGGVAADGTFVSVVRFESEAAATANSERPEQGAWWEATAAAFDGDVTFTNCPDVDSFGAGGSDEAGFVQVMVGRGDRAVIQPLAAEVDEALARMRPDVIGGIVAWPGDGTFVQVVYFTSEAEARANEGLASATDEDKAAMERLGSLMTVDRYIDLSDPWLYSPR